MKNNQYSSNRAPSPRHTLAAALLTLTLLGAAAATAANITFSTPVTISGATDVSTTGTLLAAYTFDGTAATVNGVAFAESGADSGAVGSYFSLSSFGSIYGSYNGTGTFTGLPAVYQDILKGGIYNSTAATTATVTLTDLIPGHQYAVQVWVDDSRGTAEGTRQETISDLAASSPQTLKFNSTDNTGGVGQFSIGTFTANALTQPFMLASSGTNLPQMNTIQLRDVGANYGIGYWNGLNSGTLDSISPNFCSNLTNAALVQATLTTVQGLTPNVFFADSFSSNSIAIPVTNTSLSVVVGGLTITNLFFVNNNSNYTIASADAKGITGNSSVIMGGSGTTTLAGTHSYTGSTTVGAGTLDLTGTLAGGGALTVSGGMLNLSGSATGGSALTSSGGTFNLSGSASGGGPLTVNSGAFNLSGTVDSTNVTLNGGMLTLSGVNNPLPGGAHVNFAGGGTLTVSGISQTVTNVAVADSVSATGTGVGGTLTVNGPFFRVGNTNTTGLATLNLSALASFVYTNPAGVFDVGGQYNGGAAAVNAYGVLYLATNTTITANQFSIGDNGSDDEATEYSTGKVWMAQSTIINANTIQLGITSQRAGPSGALAFQTGLSNPTLTIRAANGTGAVPNTIVLANISDSGYPPSAIGTIDLTTGVTGTSQLNALINEMIIGENSYANGNNNPVTASFLMGGGTLSGTEILVAHKATGSGTGTVTGTFSLSGGTVTASNITLGDQQANGTVNATFTLNSGVVQAQTIQPGAGTATRTFNWNGGTISNYNSSTALTIASGLTLTLGGSGTPTFGVASGLTTTVNAVLAGANGLTVVGSGTVLLGGVNTYTGQTTINHGELAGLTGGSIVSSVTVNSGGTLGVSVASTSQQWTCPNLTNYAGTTLDFNFGALTPGTSTAPLQVNGSVAFNGTPTVTVEAGSLPVGTYPLMSWTGTQSGTAPTIASLFRTANNLTISGNTLYLNVTGTTEPIRWAPASGGSGNWDISISENWKDDTGTPTYYEQPVVPGDQVVLDETYITAAPVITLNTNVAPASVIVSNTIYSYTISGSGGIAGTAGLTTLGTGSLTLDTTNTFTGPMTIGAGSVTIGGAGKLGGGAYAAAIANSGTFTYNSSAAQTLSGVISGPGALTASGPGALNLSGANIYSGPTTLNAGTVNLGVAEVAGTSGPLGPLAESTPGDIVLNGGYLQYSAANQYDYSAGFSTAANQQYNVNTAGTNVTWATALTSSGGSLTKNGAGTLTLNGANTYTGNTTLNAGSLTIINGGALGTGALIVNLTASGTFLADASTSADTIANNITLPAPTTAQTYTLVKDTAGSTAGTALSLNGAISGGSTNATLFLNSNVAGDNTTAYVFNGTNTFLGTINLNRGCIVVANPASLGASSNLIYLDGNNNTTAGDLQFANSMTLTNPIQLVSGCPIGTGPNNATLQGVISGMAPLNLVGNGILTLAAANTYTGNTLVSAGTLALAATGSISNSPTISVASGATFDVSAQGGAFALNTGQTIAGLGGVNGSFTVLSNAVVAPGGASTGTLVFSNDLTLAGNAILTNVTTTGSGPVDLVQVNGNLNLLGTNFLSLSLPIQLALAPGTYPLINYSEALTGGATNLVVYPVLTRLTMTIDTTSTPGVVNLVVSGSNGNLVWIGGLNTNAWDDAITANWFNGVSADVFYLADAVTFSDSGANNPGVNLVGTLYPSAVTVNSSSNYTFSGSGKISGTTSLTKSGNGTLVLGNTTNDYTGGTTVNGGTLQIGSGTSGAVGGPIANTATVTYYRADTAAINISNSLSGSGVFNIQSTGTLLQGNFTLSGDNSGVTGTMVANNARVAVASQAELGGAPVVVATNGGEIYLTAVGTFNNTFEVSGIGWTESVGNLGTIRLQGNGTTVAGQVILLGNTLFSTYSSSDSGTISGVISDGGSGYGFTKSGSGTLTLSGDNTYTGPTIVSNGTVNVTGNESAATGGWSMPINAATATVNFQAGSTVMVASNATIKVGSSPANGTPNAQTLNAAGIVTNNGSVLVARGGYLNVTNGGTWFQTGNMTVSPPVGSGYSALLTVVSGAAFTYAGTNLIVLSPSSGNSGEGLLTINGGTFTTGQGFTNNVTPQPAGTTGYAQLILETNGTLVLSTNIPQLTSGYNTNSTASISLGGGGGVINLAGYSTAITNIIGGAGGLTELGAGTLTLGAVNTYTGATIVSNSTLVVNGRLAPASTVTVASNAALGGIGNIGGPTTIQGGGLVQPGAGTLTISNLTFGVVATDLCTNAFNLGAGGNIYTTTLTLNGTNVVNILDASLTISTYNLISYSTERRFGSAGFVLGLLPPNTGGYLQDSGSAIQLVVTNGGVPPVVAVTPATTNVFALSTVVFTASVTSGTAPFTYQWTDNHDNAIAGATNATLTLTNLAVTQSGNYTVNVTNAVGNASAFGTLNVSALAAPTLSGGVTLGNGAFQLTFSGPAGEMFTILSTTNLATPHTNWTVLTNGTFGAGSVLFADPTATNRPQQFYLITAP